ncbi:hypothetical protein CAEBREN_23869 [Caenorhabditis brenneri]|uniref:Uncharacterized protein n=1 Tax=Caenorhabditis brenneri TaxID=135651 RepID=G0NV51_CAEBE|nr:hypothetical protein CAEBREN_23869 [Caenorhabditis brenneri]
MEGITGFRKENGALSNEKGRLAKHASECQMFYNGFIKDLGNMIKKANTVLELFDVVLVVREQNFPVVKEEFEGEIRVGSTS